MKTNILLILILSSGFAKAQLVADPIVPGRWKSLAEISLSGNASQFTGAASLQRLYEFGKNRKFKMGYGLRFNAYRSSDKEFITAPATLTSKQEGPQVLFSKTYEENLDTFKVASARVNSFNAAIYLEYAFTPKFQVGFNIDAIGFSFGKKTKGTIRSTYGNFSPEARPYGFNLLLVSDNDLGSLNSEIFARYFISPQWAIKAGGSFLFTEYQTETKDILNNDRYRNKSLTFMLGVSFCP